MRYEYIDPIVSTAVRILAQMVPGTDRAGEIVMVSGEQAGDEVNVVIGLAGDSPGDVVISMGAPTAQGVCSLLLGGRLDGMTESGSDALAELGNMIAGNAISALNDLGFDFSLQPPRLAVGCRPPGLDGREALLVPLVTPYREISMQFLLDAD